MKKKTILILVLFVMMVVMVTPALAKGEGPPPYDRGNPGNSPIERFFPHPSWQGCQKALNNSHNEAANCDQWWIWFTDPRP